MEPSVSAAELFELLVQFNDNPLPGVAGDEPSFQVFGDAASVLFAVAESLPAARVMKLSFVSPTHGGTRRELHYLSYVEHADRCVSFYGNHAPAELQEKLAASLPRGVQGQWSTEHIPSPPAGQLARIRASWNTHFAQCMATRLERDTSAAAAMPRLVRF